MSDRTLAAGRLRLPSSVVSRALTSAASVGAKTVKGPSVPSVSVGVGGRQGRLARVLSIVDGDGVGARLVEAHVDELSAPTALEGGVAGSFHRPFVIFVNGEGEDVKLRGPVGHRGLTRPSNAQVLPFFGLVGLLPEVAGRKGDGREQGQGQMERVACDAHDWVGEE
ncbi:MAG: hypothetical protein BRD38_01965 [Bacteroidetes bacterium QH_9_67_14]|nr:MAG: hypothetical protein BRD38_01965 [Bacteroidetes bacterium QH_9_67_14]